MRSQKTPFGSQAPNVFPPRDGYLGGEMRRRIADCRERLRRGRAARRIAGRASSPAEILPAEKAETAGASATSGTLGIKT